MPVVLYVDDKKELNKEDKKNILRDEKDWKFENIGHKNSHHQIKKFERNSQPFLAILDQHGRLIIDHIGYKSTSIEYHKFLVKGLDNNIPIKN